MTFVEQNTNRLYHLLALYQMSKDDLLSRLNEGRKRLLSYKDIFSDEINLSHLKKIDDIFNKGLSYYLNPSDPIKSQDESIFFRKNSFNGNLNLASKQIVNHYEEEKMKLSVILKLSDFTLDRTLPIYTGSHDPKKVAIEIRKLLYPSFSTDKRTFLKSFIEKLGEYNIIVYEFIEHHKKKEKVNLDGFFIGPNVIVLKRTKYFSREIFTLAHELAHYLLDYEEIDQIVYDEVVSNFTGNKVEHWCNSFAYHFLIGQYADEMSRLTLANSKNDYHFEFIKLVSLKTHLSSISLYTRLLLTDRISYHDYENVKQEILESIRIREIEEKARLELENQKKRANGEDVIIQPPKPIISPMLLKTVRSALDIGIINELEFCNRLNIKPEKIENYYR